MLSIMNIPYPNPTYCFGRPLDGQNIDPVLVFKTLFPQKHWLYIKLCFALTHTQEVKVSWPGSWILPENVLNLVRIKQSANRGWLRWDSLRSWHLLFVLCTGRSSCNEAQGQNEIPNPSSGPWISSCQLRRGVHKVEQAHSEEVEPAGQDLGEGQGEFKEISAQNQNLYLDLVELN